MALTPVRVRKHFPLKGRRTSWPPDDIGDEFSPDNLNVRFRFGEVRNAPGRGIFASPDPVAESPTFLGNFSKIDGITRWSLKLTTTELRRLGNTTPGVPEQWQLVQPSYVPTGSRRWGTAVGEDHFFFSRGDNPINQWDGNPAHKWNVITPLDGTVPQARFLEYFNNRLIAAYTTEGGITFANRIRWPRSANFQRWDDTVGLGAGFLDVTDEEEEPLTGIRGLGERLAVYTRHSIKEMVATGSLDPVHVIQSRVRGIGCAAPYTLASNGPLHFFMAHDRNIWAWDGNIPTPVGSAIWEELRAMTYVSDFDNYFGFCSLSRNEYWLVLSPHSDIFVYDYLRGVWSRDSMANLSTLGEIDRHFNTIIWTALVGSWQAQTLQWQQFQGFTQTYLAGGLSPGATIVIDESIIHDYFALGSIMDRFVETPDYYLDDDPMEMKTVQRVLLIYEFVTDDPFEFSFSLDKGRSWNMQEVVPNCTGYSLIDLFCTGNVIRFRFRETNATGCFRWRSVVYEFIDGGPFIGFQPGTDPCNEGVPPNPPPVQITVGIGTDDAYVGSINVTPPGVVYGPFAGGGSGTPFCIDTLVYDSGTVVTFIASAPIVGSAWSSDFVDQISTGADNPLITTINGNTAAVASDPCVVGVDATHGNVFFQSSPAGASLELRTLVAWNGFYRIEFGATLLDFPVATPANDFSTIATGIVVPVGANVKVSMLNGAHAPLCINPAQSFSFLDGAFGAGWSPVTSANCGLGYLYTATQQLIDNFPVVFVVANTSP